MTVALLKAFLSLFITVLAKLIVIIANTLTFSLQQAFEN